MRLLNARTLTFHEFYDAQIPPYAILSRRWGEDEVTYQEFISGAARDGTGLGKIEQCCGFAQECSLDWVGVDTCCINKESSVELTETVNSMFSCYRKASECYVYLADVRSLTRSRAAWENEKTRTLRLTEIAFLSMKHMVRSWMGIARTCRPSSSHLLQ